MVKTILLSFCLVNRSNGLSEPSQFLWQPYRTPCAVRFVATSHEVNGANLLRTTNESMDRQQIIAVIFTVLMVGSMVAWGATLI